MTGIMSCVACVCVCVCVCVLASASPRRHSLRTQRCGFLLRMTLRAGCFPDPRNALSPVSLRGRGQEPPEAPTRTPASQGRGRRTVTPVRQNKISLKM